MESYREDGSRKLSEIHRKRMRSNGLSSPLGKFVLPIKDKICTMTVLKHWEHFPERLWNLCPHKDSKLDWTRAWAVRPPLSCGYWRKWRPEVPSKQNFMVLCFPIIAVSLTAWHTSREKSWHDMTWAQLINNYIRKYKLVKSTGFYGKQILSNWLDIFIW